ncbi:MAG: GAF domain-containing sensor histidine kinase [Elusimicrobiota bacterium]|nr:GAF domain-containing sensor histidine kinase [Elusimicrobiota bacterium]
MITQSQESLEMLVMVSRLLSSKLDISELLTTIMRLASRVVGAERASLYLLDEKAQELYFDVALGLPEDVQKMRFKLGEGVAGTCAKEGRSIIINDTATDPRHSKKADSKSGFTTKSLLTCPMIIKGKVIGVVQAINRIEGDFSEIDKNNFEAFSSQAAIAIENSRLFSSVREEKRKMEIVFKRIKEGAILTDINGGIVIINSSAKTYLEHEKYKFENIRDAFHDFTVKPALETILSGEEPVAHLELYREKPKRFYLDGSAIKLFKEDKEGNQIPEGRLWILADVTAQRLEERMARNFLSLISHKFKTPLASINGYAQILRDEAHSKEMPEMVRKSSDTIYTQGLKLNALVESLLDFVTIDDLDASSLEKMEFDAADFLGEIAEDARGRFKDMAGLTIKIAAPEPVKIKADRKILAAAVKSLINNAVKFNPGKDKLVILSAQSRDNHALISVGDNGPGIPGEELENIFHRFYQVEASFTGQVEGWGLGLALVKKIAEVHGGKIFTRSQLQKGSAFTLAIPN